MGRWPWQQIDPSRHQQHRKQQHSLEHKAPDSLALVSIAPSMLVPIWNGLSTDRSDLEWSVLTILRWSSLLLPSWAAKSRKIKSALLSNCSVDACSTLEWFFYWPFHFGIVIFFLLGCQIQRGQIRPFSLLLPWCLIFFGMVCPWTVPLCNTILPSWAATIQNVKTRVSLYCSPNAYSTLEWSIHWLFHFGIVFCLHGLRKNPTR